MLTDMSNGNAEDESNDGHNYTEAVGTRLSPETRDRLEEYKGEHEISNSEALRRLVRSGLDVEHENDRAPLLTGMYVAGLLGVLVSLSGQTDVFALAFSSLILLIALFFNFTNYQIPDI